MLVYYWTVEKPLGVFEITERGSKTENRSQQNACWSQNGGCIGGGPRPQVTHVFSRENCSVRTADVSLQVSPGLGHAIECQGCCSKLTRI